MPRLTKRAIAIKECEALAERQVKKAFIRLCFDEEDSLEAFRKAHKMKVLSKQ